MPVRSSLAVLLLLALAGCDIIGSDTGDFQATLTDADGSRTTLEGSAVYEAQEGGATILLLPRALGLDTEIRLLVADAALAEGAVPIGTDARLSYVIRNGQRPFPADPNNPLPPRDGGALVYEGEGGTVTLSRLSDGSAEGRIEAFLAVDGEEPLSLSGRFRAVAR